MTEISKVLFVYDDLANPNADDRQALVVTEIYNRVQLWAAQGVLDHTYVYLDKTTARLLATALSDWANTQE